MNEEKSFGDDFDLEDVSVSREKSEDRKVVGACPLCGSDVYEYSWGWGCSRGKDQCSFTLSKTICEHDVSGEEISDLLIKGETGVINDFVGKNGNPFSARLTYKDKFAFAFVNEKKEQ